MMSQDPHSEQKLTDSLPDGASEEEQLSQAQEPDSIGWSLTQTQWAIFAVVLALVVVGISVMAYRTTAGWLATRNTITTTPSPENAVPTITTPVAEVPDEISPVEGGTAVTAPEISTMEAETPSVALSDCAAAPPPETVGIFPENSSTPADWCSAMGDVALSQGQYLEAIRLLHQALDLRPDDGAILQRLAFAYAMIGDNIKAIELYKTSLDLNPAPYAYTQLGRLYIEQGQYNEAKAVFEKLRSVSPNDSSAEVGLGDIAYLQEQYSIAREAYDRAITMNPNTPDAYIGRGDVSRALGDMDQALQDYKKATETTLVVGEHMITAPLRRADVYLGLNQPELAIEEYLKAREQDPDNWEIYHLLGRAYWELQGQWLAIENYNVALALKPDAASVYLDRAEAYETLDDQQALADTNRALELTTDPELIQRGEALRERIEAVIGR